MVFVFLLQGKFVQTQTNKKKHEIFDSFDILLFH